MAAALTENKLFPPPHHEAAWHAASRAATLRGCCYPAPHHQHERLAGAVFRVDPPDILSCGNAVY